MTRGGLGHPLERHLAEVGGQQEAELGEEDQDAGDDHDDVPDPDDQVDLLVDDVDGEVAHSRHQGRLAAVANKVHVADYN